MFKKREVVREALTDAIDVSFISAKTKVFAVDGFNKEGIFD